LATTQVLLRRCRWPTNHGRDAGITMTIHDVCPPLALQGCRRRSQQVRRAGLLHRNRCCMLHAAPMRGVGRACIMPAPEPAAGRLLSEGGDGDVNLLTGLDGAAGGGADRDTDMPQAGARSPCPYFR
jgi:hypothetical protein